MTYYGKGSEMDFLRGQDVEDADELIQEYCTHPFFSKAWHYDYNDQSLWTDQLAPQPVSILITAR
ncbi:hypothetical protein EBT25_18140, partial [bacterium]|nr:hypothetical protein [bacterium]